MTPRHARVFASWLLAGAVALSFGLTVHAVGDARDDGAPAVPSRAGSLPIVAERHYRMAAKVRPLLLFWIGRDDVGAARVVWRQGPDGTGFDLLIGSDPSRAPRRINRWGYIAEESQGGEARLLGVMKQSNEQSLEEAQSRLAREAQTGEYVFKAIHGMAHGDEASSTITTVRVTRDLTFRDVDELMDLVERNGTATSVRRVRLPDGTRPGFLVALAELIHRDVAAYGRPAAPKKTRRATTLPYIYNGALNDLKLRDSERLQEIRLGTRDYRDVIRARFETRSRASGAATEFELIYGASGTFAEVPVHVVYQPRWWLQVELFLDEAAQS